MDAVNQFDYQGMLNNPNLFNGFDPMNGQGGFPNISFVNLADLQGTGGIPNKQKIKKKKAAEEVKKFVEQSAEKVPDRDLYEIELP